MSLSFGEFELDQERRQLLRSGTPVPLERKDYELLSLLVERRPRALSRAQIRDVVWPGVFISESRLSQAVNNIRRALDDDARLPRFVRTVHGFGYAFCGTVSIECATSQENLQRSSGTVVATGKRKLQLLRLGIAAALSLVGAATLLRAPWRTHDSPQVVAKHTQVTFLGNVVDVAISPDGRAMAHVVRDEPYQRLLVADVDGGTALELARGPRFEQLGWSSDGSREVFVGPEDPPGRWGIWCISRFGGERRRIASSGYYSAWSGGGSRLAVATGNEGGFRIVDVARGTEASPVRLSGAGAGMLGGLDWGSRTNRLALVGHLRESARWAVWTTRPDGTEQRLIYSDERPLTTLRWSASGDELYVGRVLDESAEILSLPDDERGTKKSRILLSGLAPTRFSTSADGRRLLLTRALTYSNVSLIELGRSTRDPRRLTEGTSRFLNPRISPDGEWIVASSRLNIVKLPVVGGQPIALTAGNQGDVNPVWSPDGKRIAFGSTRDGKRRIWIMGADGNDQGALDLPDVSSNLPAEWTPDGRLSWQQQVGGGQYMNYRIRDLHTGQEELLADAANGGWIFYPRFSPGGERVAVVWNRRGGPGLWLISSPGRRETFVRKGARPLGWSPDGQWVYAYVSRAPGASSAQEIVRVSIRTGESEHVASVPVGSIMGGDVSRAGRQIVLSVEEVTSDAWLVEDFDPRVPSRSR